MSPQFWVQMVCLAPGSAQRSPPRLCDSQGSPEHGSAGGAVGSIREHSLHRAQHMLTTRRRQLLSSRTLIKLTLSFSSRGQPCRGWKI